MQHCIQVSGSQFSTDKAERPITSVIYYLLAPAELRAEEVKLEPTAQIPAKHRSEAGYFHTNHSELPDEAFHVALTDNVARWLIFSF